jgi:AraC family transcriptional regulator, regulatory protein of adaptative response / DNA-3-methyladenine glycosylase II
MADLDFDRCYLATESRDARFDGLFIVGVRTTGVYCRPSCPSPVTPKRRNVAFYRTAAAAQVAGLRACKRCRPDAIPGSPEWDIRGDLVGRAMRLIADGIVERAGVPGLARQLAVSERHLNRLLRGTVGAPALALARSRRAQTARLLIEGTRLSFTEVAFAAGFASVRQFNDTIRNVYDASPTELRGRGAGHGNGTSGWLTLSLPARLPYDQTGVFEWLGARAVPGLEEVEGGVYRRALRLPHGAGVVELEPEPTWLRATLRLETVDDLISAVNRCRRLFDLDADPLAYGPVFASDELMTRLVDAWPGMRIPATVDPAETAVRAVIGQQISLRAARTITGRLVAELGTPLGQPHGAVTHTFPEPEVLAEADLGSLGLLRARCETVRELARQLADGRLVLDPGADRAEAEARLREIPGIGAWTTAYIALRALRDPDAFPAGDLGLRRAARALGLPGDARSLAARAERWRPWRGYAAHYLWAADR